MKQFLAAMVCSLGSLGVWAHPPDEHGKHADHAHAKAEIRAWTNAKTGEVVRGAFLAARMGDGTPTVSIERENGDVVAFPFDDLAEADRAETRKRIEQIRALNEGVTAQPGASGTAGVQPNRPGQASSFEAFAPFVRTRWDEQWLYVESDALPHPPWDYAPMVGIRSWQQQVPLPQAYVGDNAWRIPLKPELADKPISGRTALYRGAIALAANGVPIFNALNNRGDDTAKAGELDDYGGHSGRGDDYHYHVAPLAIQGIVGRGRPIAYALDGFPLYGLFDPEAKAGEDKACPLGGTERLDELNGHFGAATPGSASGAKGLYHYHASREYPYINGGIRGKVTVKDDQIEPQPRAQPVRPWLQPLRGATITGFKRLGQNSWSLEYSLAQKLHHVNFRIDGAGRDAKYVFEFVGPDKTTTEVYQARPPRDRADPNRNPPGERRDRPSRDERIVRPPEGPSPEDHQHEPEVAKGRDGFVLSSTDVADGRLSIECTCDAAGPSRAPALAWRGAPEGTKAFAVVMHHIPPDGGTHVYLVIANIPASAGTGELASGGARVGIWGRNTVNGRAEYTPPCSKGPGDKTYTITLYALSAPVPPGELANGRLLTRESLLGAIRDTTLATASLDVKYSRHPAAK